MCAPCSGERSSGGLQEEELSLGPRPPGANAQGRQEPHEPSPASKGPFRGRHILSCLITTIMRTAGYLFSIFNKEFMLQVTPRFFIQDFWSRSFPYCKADLSFIPWPCLLSTSGCGHDPPPPSCAAVSLGPSQFNLSSLPKPFSQATQNYSPSDPRNRLSHLSFFRL